MEKITIKDFDEVYALFEKAFPLAELRPYESMKELFENNEFVIYSYQRENQIVGALIVWELSDFVYLENFAVDESLRGQGIGSYFLEEAQKLYSNKLIVLEVEEPMNSITKRRVAFYERNHYILNPYHFIQPALRENVSKVELMLMSYPTAIDVYTFDQIKKQIFRVVYHQGI
ncbi:GNAT family N-acetyltransferase [Candidatus Stoquefichus sp. SB1]|uniref:GNAT family N-acetyltransferase n=1 Tax=Candidatus Stoquefichus sp. SB1 TaxID=1658109 RepID=UPI00067EAC51|nr:GNAT family N-acetyltransferase [Candidatus Stoquefichus sp. SB1]